MGLAGGGKLCVLLAAVAKNLGCFVGTAGCSGVGGGGVGYVGQKMRPEDGAGRWGQEMKPAGGGCSSARALASPRLAWRQPAPTPAAEDQMKMAAA